MKFLITCLLLLQPFLGLKAQKSFEGLVKFKTDISVTNPAATNYLRQLENKYGDSLNLYYSSDGHFLREYLNTGEGGNDRQLYLKGSGQLLITTKGSDQVETLDVSLNSLKLIEKTKSKTDTIMGLPCTCYSFKAFDSFDERTLTFCYSKKTPKIKKKYFESDQDYFVAQFYELSKRPYLKFSINAAAFTLTFTAVELKKMKLDDKMFMK